MFITAESAILMEGLITLFSICWVLYGNKDASPARRHWLGRLWLDFVCFKNKQRLNLFAQDLEAHPEIPNLKGNNDRMSE